jgi:hypothetical protein
LGGGGRLDERLTTFVKKILLRTAKTWKSNAIQQTFLKKAVVEEFFCQ